MASGVTSYQTTDHRMNYSYVAGKSGYDAQIRVHYNTSRLNSSTVRAKIDVEVYYNPTNYASTNCCAVFLDGSGTGQMLNQTCQKGNCANFADLGTNRLYASHPATSKTQYTGSAGTWVTKDYSVSYNKTSFTVTVYFCNRYGYGNYPTNIWNAASSYPLTFTIPCEVGYTSAGNPGSPTRSAQWFEGKCSFSWSAAANGTNNSVTGYDWIIDRSSSAGGTSGWTQIASGSTSSGTRSCTSPSISTAYRGYNFRCRVKTKATYGSYSYKNGTSYSRYNYAPSISGTYVSFGATSGSYVQCGSSVTAKGGSDSGGYASGSTLQYNLNINGTWTGYSTSSSNSSGCTWSSKLTTFGGRLISFQVRAYDGFTTATSGTISKAIGSRLANSFSFGSGTLSYTTSFSIPKSTVDGYNFATGVTEHLTLYAKKSSDTDYTQIYYGTRSGSSLTSSRSITGILGSLMDKGIVDLEDQSGTAQRINFKLEIRITDNSNPTHCHLTKTITGNRTYTNWVISNWLSYPDSSTTYKFPFDSGIPIITSTFRINWRFDSYPAGQLNNGTLCRNIYYKSLNSTGGWTLYSTKYFEDSVSETGYEDFPITDFASRGDKIEILMAWEWHGYKVCEDPSIKWDYSGIPNENDQKTIYYRPYPTLYLSSANFTDAQMLTPNVAENRVAWDTSLTMEDDGRLMKIKKAYLTVCEWDEVKDSAEIPLDTIIGSGGGNMELNHTYSNWYRITDNIDNNLQYHRLSYSLYNEDNPNVENGGENESAAFDVNRGYRLVQAFDFCELYRATPTGTLSDTLYESDLRTYNVSTELFFDTISTPYFDATDNLAWSRYNYSSSN
jgi:hypothetical protein